MSGLPTRIFSRRSCCSPFITPMMTMSALTPTSTPPMAMMLISESSLEPRRLRKYLHAICNSSVVTLVSSSEKELHRAQIILIYSRCLFIARRTQLGLCLESPPLVQRIVQLAEGVCHLLPIREQLEPLG